jgi:hypothetical protein
MTLFPYSRSRNLDKKVLSRFRFARRMRGRQDSACRLIQRTCGNRGSIPLNGWILKRKYSQKLPPYWRATTAISSVEANIPFGSESVF